MRRSLLFVSLLALSGACGNTSPNPGDPGAPEQTDGGGGSSGETDGGSGGTSDAGQTTDAGPNADAGVDGGSTSDDNDHDGLPDAYEQQIAESYLPFLALDSNDGCPLGGILYRITRHPQNPALLHVKMIHLYQKDCGLNGHVGDDEMFAFTVDPSKPGPAGVTAMIAISHQGTPCERTTTCGVCNGLKACELAADGRPIVFASKDKHGSYVNRNTCNTGFCFDQCAAAGNASAMVDLVNAGEPDGQLVTNLTTQGFITAANGWTEPTLMDFNPWEQGKEFGKAGVVADDLVDPAVDTEACTAP